jgi:hypothetical protein
MVVLAREKDLGFEFGDESFDGIDFARKLAQKLFALLGARFLAGQSNVGFDVAGKTRQLLPCGDLLFRLLALAKNPLGLFLVLPKAGAGSFLF